MRAHTHTERERERERETPRTLYRCRPCAVIKYRQLTKHFTGWHDWQLLSTLRNFQLAIWQSHDTSQNILLCLFWYCIYSSCDASCYHTSAETRCTDDRSDRKHISTQWTWMKVSSLDTGLKSTKWHSLLRSACISRILAVTSVVRKLTIRNLCIMYPVNPRKTKSLLFVFYTNKLQYFCKSLSLVYVDRFLPRDAISALLGVGWWLYISQSCIVSKHIKLFSRPSKMNRCLNVCGTRHTVYIIYYPRYGLTLLEGLGLEDIPIHSASNKL